MPVPLTVKDLLGSSKTPSASGQGSPEATKLLLQEQGLPPEVVTWLLGDVKSTPAVIDKVMDDVSKKINMSMALILVRRMVSMNRMLEYMAKVEDDMFDDSAIAESSKDQKFTRYSYFERAVGTMMEFTRKFVAQNEHSFTHDQPADELAILLRTVDPEVLRTLVDMFRSKGSALTERDLKGALGDVSKSSVSEGLVE